MQGVDSATQYQPAGLLLHGRGMTVAEFIQLLQLFDEKSIMDDTYTTNFRYYHVEFDPSDERKQTATFVERHEKWQLLSVSVPPADVTVTDQQRLTVADFIDALQEIDDAGHSNDEVVYRGQYLLPSLVISPRQACRTPRNPYYTTDSDKIARAIAFLTDSDVPSSSDVERLSRELSGGVDGGDGSATYCVGSHIFNERSLYTAFPGVESVRFEYLRWNKLMVTLVDERVFMFMMSFESMKRHFGRSLVEVVVDN